MKRTPEANAKRSESMKAVWAARKAQREHDAIHSTIPRNCHPQHFQKLRDRLWQEVKQWFEEVAR